jgi:hypothetical protein
MSSPAQYNAPKWEVADIFREHGAVYRQKNKLTGKQRKVMRAITTCRTATYGIHIDQCNRCGHTQEDYNSCRDRHCPKCQGIARKKWVTQRIEDILPVAHYHVIFTLPHLLHDIISHNRRLIYNLLFSTSAATLLKFGRDPEWLGGEIGFYGVLHTWGQTLWQHPHVHYVVPGGGLTPDGSWGEPLYPKKFLFPVRALSKVFMGKFVEGLKAAYASGDLVIPATNKSIENPAAFERFVDRLVARKWVVYCKPPFGDAREVVNYIGRYTHRVAISNHRILAVDEEGVEFRYKDYRKNRILWREMRLAPPEFIRRFLSHVLPPGFHKIRNFGFLANGRRKTSIAIIRSLLSDREALSGNSTPHATGQPCPVCEKGRVRTRLIFNGLGRMVSILLPPRINYYAYDTA